MKSLPLEAAQKIVAGALELARAQSLHPLCVVVLDARGAVKAAGAEDGTSLARFDIAFGKANGAVAMGLGSRAIATRPPQFLAALAVTIRGGLVPVPGGVLVRDAEGTLVGAVGISGDNSDNDERAAVAGISAAGLQADTGA